MKLEPTFAGDTLDEKIVSMRKYFEAQFIDDYDDWNHITNLANKNIGTYLRKIELDTDAIPPFTYDEFCRGYIANVEVFMVQNGTYSISHIVPIVECMIAERTPQWVIDYAQDRHRRSSLEFPEQDEQPTTVYPDSGPMSAEEADDTVYPAREPEQPSVKYIPEIWRIQLGSVEIVYLDNLELPFDDFETEE